MKSSKPSNHETVSETKPAKKLTLERETVTQLRVRAGVKAGHTNDSFTLIIR